MELVPVEVIAQICSYTDDDTIFNFASSSRKFNSIVKSARHMIEFFRNNEPTYELNVLNNIPSEITAIPYNIHNLENCNVIKPYIEDNLGIVEHKYQISSIDDTERYTTHYFNADLLANDLIKSVKVKGNIIKISFQINNEGSFYDSMTNAFINLLPTDEQGYTEILTHFIPFIYIRIFPLCNIVIRIYHIGNVEIKSTFYNLFSHTIQTIDDNTIRRCDKLFTYVLIPEMLYSNKSLNNSKLFQVYPSWISKGFAIVLKNKKHIINNPDSVIKEIHLSILSSSFTSSTYKLNSKKIMSNKIINNKIYNLNFDIQNCLYIPLENINFTRIKNTHQVIINVVYHKEHTYKNDELMIDVIYFNKNMILNERGFGSRYYW
jgi:hypothetical protein